MKLKIGGTLDMSTVDYPGKVSSVVFLYGCNFRCPYCYNVSLVMGGNYKEVEVSEIVDEIKRHKDFLDAVAITGGEPTLQLKGLMDLCKRLRDLNLSVKIDTNGSRPDALKELVKCLNFVSLDVKAPPDKYNIASGASVDSATLSNSLKILKNSHIDYEVRTTVVPGLNDSESDIVKICKFLGSVNVYVLQQFRPEKETIDPRFSSVPKMDRKQIRSLAEIAKKAGLNVKIRTEEGGEVAV